MHERFSDRARRAMALANREATELRHDYLSPAHLMLGLIAEGECVATATLKNLNVDLDELRNKVNTVLGTGDSSDGSFGRRAQTKEMKEVIAKGIEEARKLGHRYVGTEHLMLALLQVDAGIPARVLREHGLDLDTVREQTLAVLRSTDASENDEQTLHHGDFEWAHQQELSKAFRSPKFWHTLILAVDSANRLGAGEIGPEHLLLALVRDNESELKNLLAEKGVTADWIRDRITSS